MDIVEVKWRDTSHISDDVEECDLANIQVTVFTTHGILLDDNLDSVIVAGSKCIDFQTKRPVYRSVSAIPKECVVAIKYLEVK